MRRYAAPPATAPRIYLGRIPHGYAGTLRTAGHVKRLIREGAKDFYVRQRAIDILLAQGVRPKHYLREIEALFEWVQRNVRYTKDPFRVEVLHSPRRMLELRAGDCDDMTILLGAMLEAIGHPVRLVLTGPDPLKPRLFSHIYLEVNHRGRWIPLDATMPYPLGWAPRALVKQVVPIQEEPKHAIRGQRVAGRGGPAAGAGLALGTDPRDPTRRSGGEGPESEAALGPAPQPGGAGAEPVAQAPASLHLGQRTDSAPPPPHEPAAQVAAPALGDSASAHGPRTGRGPEYDRARWGASARPPASAGDAAAGRPRAAGRAAGVEALSDEVLRSPSERAPGTALHRAEAQTLSGYVRQGAGLYRRFNRFGPGWVTRVAHCRVIPPVVVQLGDLVGLIYRSDKWLPGHPRTYIHFMQDPPRLTSDVAGRRLFVVGGTYRVTPRGIEG